MNVIINEVIKINDEIFELLFLADPSKESINKYINKSVKFGAYVNDSVIGIIVLTEIIKDTYEIMNIAVKPDFQGKGIGYKLINRCIDYAKANNIKFLEIGTGNNGFMQLYLYQKCGFRMVSIETDYFIKNYKEEIFENGLQCMDMVRLRKKI